jgi:hypothetical protein
MKPYDTVNDDFSKFIMERAIAGMTGQTSYGQIEEASCNHSGAGTSCPKHGDADCNSSKQNRKEEVEIEEGLKQARKNVGMDPNKPSCWKGYKATGTKMKGGKQVPDCKKEEVEIEEGLKGGQHKIDANKNGKIDGHDFAILRGKKNKKSMKEMWQLAAEAKAKIEVMPEIDDRDPGNIKKKGEKKEEEKKEKKY